MNNFMERFKDFIYDIVDYLLIIVIVLVVGGIIAWRLDILFTQDVDKAPIQYAEESSSQETVNENVSTEDQGLEEDKDQDDTEQGDVESPSSDEPMESSDTPSDSEVSNAVITVKIPNGSLPPTIANMLLEKGLISDKNEFLSKAQELKLDTKLQSGEFEIKENSSLEDVIKIIARKK